jgi:hypothetical protein
MRTAWTIHQGKAWLISWFSLGVLAATNPGSAAADSSSSQSSATNQNIGQLHTAVVHLSPGLAEVLRMVKARLDLDVVKTYIKSTNVPFNPTAEEIVTLKRLGMPEDLITAILERDGELRIRQAPRTRTTRVMPEDITPRPAYNNPPAPYQIPSPIPVNPAPSGYAFYRPPQLIFGGQVVSFNNSFPTFVNGQPVYSGYYVPGYFW